MGAQGWRAAGIESIPALGASAEPSFWEDWTQDPSFARRWHSVGRSLGIRSFGANASSGDTGQELVAGHDELEFGRQEELYVLIHGRARFELDGADVELAAGEVLVVDAEVRRRATALADGTLLLAVGATPGEAYRVPEWNRE